MLQFVQHKARHIDRSFQKARPADVRNAPVNNHIGVQNLAAFGRAVRLAFFAAPPRTRTAGVRRISSFMLVIATTPRYTNATPTRTVSRMPIEAKRQQDRRQHQCQQQGRGAIPKNVAIFSLRVHDLQTLTGLYQLVERCRRDQIGRQRARGHESRSSPTTSALPVPKASR